MIIFLFLTVELPLSSTYRKSWSLQPLSSWGVSCYILGQPAADSSFTNTLFFLEGT